MFVSLRRMPVMFVCTVVAALSAPALLSSCGAEGSSRTGPASGSTTTLQTAYLLTRRLPVMMAVAALIGAASGVAGLYLSYYLDVASGAAVVLTATAVFVVAFLVAPRRGLLWRGAMARRPV